MLSFCLHRRQVFHKLSEYPVKMSPIGKSAGFGRLHALPPFILYSMPSVLPPHPGSGSVYASCRCAIICSSTPFGASQPYFSSNSLIRIVACIRRFIFSSPFFLWQENQSLASPPAFFKSGGSRIRYSYSRQSDSVCARCSCPALMITAVPFVSSNLSHHRKHSRLRPCRIKSLCLHASAENYPGPFSAPRNAGIWPAASATADRHVPRNILCRTFFFSFSFCLFGSWSFFFWLFRFWSIFFFPLCFFRSWSFYFPSVYPGLALLCGVSFFNKYLFEI